MEHISTTSSSLWLGDRLYALNIDESRLFTEPPSAHMDMTDAQNGQNWSITLNAELLHSLGNDELPRGIGGFFKIVKTALLLENERITFSYNFGTDAEKQEGIRGKQEAVSGDSLYITISWTPFKDPVVFTLVFPQVSPPQVHDEGDIPAGTKAMMAEIRRSNESLMKENEVNKSKIEMLNAEVDELRGTVAQLKRDHEELLNVIAGSWNVWMKQTPATEVRKLRHDLITLKEGTKSQAMKGVLFDPLETQVEEEKVKAAEAKWIAEEEAKKLPFQGSQIVGKLQQLQLNSLYGMPQQKWKLLYRGSEHGFTAESFHQHCDNKGPTMVIVKSTDNYIFGGYASISWYSPESRELSAAAAGSFLYTLVNPFGTTAKFEITANQDKALYFYSGCGPIFGFGCDLYIADCCHQNSKSYSNLGYTYSGSGPQHFFFFGVRQFQVVEYEVFGLA